MKNHETIGIIGASGDLGSRLTLQIAAHHDNLVTYDPKPAYNGTTSGVDPLLTQESVTIQPKSVDSLQEVLEAADIVHWAAPLSTLDQVKTINPGTALILHDSVMCRSQEAATKLKDRPSKIGNIAIAHCLMNSQRRVIVAENSDITGFAVDHFKNIGLEPVEITIEEHDRLMAISQGAMAILHSLLAKELSEYDAKGLLTPSGQDLRSALTKRAANWTDATLETILSNPQIDVLIRRMLDRSTTQES